MLYTKEQLNDIKSKVDYFEFYKEFLPDLQIRGKRAWTPCCFHNEQKPSLQIDIDTGIYKCWGCGKSGDIFSFYKNFYNTNFNESVQKIAEKYNVQLVFNEEEIKKQNEIKNLYNVNNIMCGRFEQQLENKLDAWNYLVEIRGLTPKIIKQFRLGCGIDNLPYSTGLEKVGLIGVSDKKEAYSNFRSDRIMFPHYNEYGNIVSFSGRKYKGDESVKKYLKTKNTQIYQSSEHIFGLYQAKQYIKKRNSVIVTEGQIDCIKCHQKGILNTVCTGGLSLSETQINLLKKYTNTFYVCVEDEAILRKNDNGITILEKFYNSIKEQIPYAKVYIIDLRQKDGSKCDPDMYLTKHTRDEFIELIKNAKIYNEYIISLYLKTMQPKNIEETTACINMLIPMLSKIQNFLDRRQYIELVGNKLNIPENLIYSKVKYYNENREKESVSTNLNYDSKPVYAQKILLSMCFCQNFDIFKTTTNIFLDKRIPFEVFYRHLLTDYIVPYVLEHKDDKPISFNQFFSNFLNNDDIDELEKQTITDIFMKSEQLEDFDDNDVLELIQEQKDTLNEYVICEPSV